MLIIYHIIMGNSSYSDRLMEYILDKKIIVNDLTENKI